MITRITLKNWKSHEETTLEFGKGVNLLIGIMGSGKSSVLDAMSFALFGTFPGAAHRRVKLSDVITGRPHPADSARVELSFEADGVAYSVARTIERAGKGEAELRKGGALVMSDPEKVTEEVCRILKLDYGVFCRAIYSEQNRMDYFLSLSPTERKRQIDELLGIDKFEAARANAATMANTLKRMRTELSRSLAEAHAEELAASLARERVALETLAAGAASCARQLSAAKTDSKEKGDELAARHSIQKAWEALERERLGVEHAVKLMESELAARAGDGAHGEAELAASVAKEEERERALAEAARAESRRLAEFAEAAGACTRAVAEHEAAAAKAEALQKSLDAVAGGLDGARTRATQARARAASLQSELALLAARQSELAAAFAELSKGGAHCPTCERELAASSREGLLAKKKAAMDDCGKRERQAGAEYASLFAASAHAEKEVADASLAATRLAEAREAAERTKLSRGELDSVSGQVALARQRVAALERERESCSAGLTKLRARHSAARELSAVRERHSQSSSRLALVRGQLAATGFDAESFERARRAADDAARSVIALEGNLRLAQEKHAACRERVAGFETALRAHEEKKAEDARLEGALRSATLLQSALVETQAALRGELIEAINETVAELWPAVYPYADYSSARLQASESDYSLELLAGSEWVPADGLASGGERACALLGLRIAMAIVIVPNLRWLVLDEPTHNLDEEGVRALVGVLRDRLPGLVSQVFVITHDEGLREATSGTLYRFGRDKAAGEPTRVLDA